MTPTTYQKPEIRDSSDNIISAGAFGKNTALSNATNDGWIDYVANDLEALNNNKADANAYLPLTGGTMTGNLNINKSVPVIILKDVNAERGTAPASNYSNVAITTYDKNNKRFWGLLHDYTTNGANKVSLIAYNGKTTDFTNSGIGIGYDGNGNLFTTAPTPAKAANDQNIATTAFVKTNLADYLPLSGGTLTGNSAYIGFEYKWASIKSVTTNDEGVMTIYGGNGDHNGAMLRLYGKNETNCPGWFQLDADNGTRRSLIGKPDETLTWAGNEIITAKGGTITGQDLYFSRQWPAIKSSYTNNEGVFSVYGGKGDNNGARLRLNGKNNSDAGWFSLLAHDGTNFKMLAGSPDGTLTWDGQPIQTSSDKRLKQDFSDVPADVLEAWGKVNWQQFKYKADAERKGDSCRFHTGLVAQDVKEVGEKNHVDLLKYGILCHDVREAVEEEKDEDGNIIKEASDAVDLWTVRYEEALAMEVIYLRNEIKKLREEIKALRS